MLDIRRLVATCSATERKEAEHAAWQMETVCHVALNCLHGAHRFSAVHLQTYATSRHVAASQRQGAGGWIQRSCVTEWPDCCWQHAVATCAWAWCGSLQSASVLAALPLNCHSRHSVARQQLGQLQCQLLLPWVHGKKLYSCCASVPEPTHRPIALLSERALSPLAHDLLQNAQTAGCEE